MKVCYVDESGDGAGDPFFVMVGILTDAARLNKTVEEFNKKLKRLRSIFPEDLRELKSTKILYGKGAWRQVDPEERKAIFRDFCAWIGERKHDVLLSAIKTEKFKVSKRPENVACVSDQWCAAALNLALQVQIKNQGLAKNKGQTFLLYDDNKQKVSNFCDVLHAPSKAVTDYYGKPAKASAFDQVIDTAFAIKSHHSGIVQVADIYAFVFRRYFELAEGGQTQAWDEESSLIKECIKALSKRLYANTSGLNNTNKTPLANWYRAIAPDTYLDLMNRKIA